MSSETNIDTTIVGSSSGDTLSINSVVTTSTDNTMEDTAEKQARKKQSRQSWKGSSKGDGNYTKGNKTAGLVEENNWNENGDERKKKEKKASKNRGLLADGTDQPKNKDDVLDLNDNKQSVAQHQRRKSTANTLDIPNKNKNSNNNLNKSSHRRGTSMANVAEIQSSSSKNAAGKSRGSKDDSENKSEALESLQQIIASLKNLPAVPPKPQKSEKKDEESHTETTSKHKRGESSINSGKRPPAAKQHKKNASVSFSFPLTSSAVTSSLKGIPDSEDGKPMDIENALQDTISSLRRMSLDKGKAQKEKEVDKRKEEYEDGETEEEKKARRKKNQNNRKSINLDEVSQYVDRNQELASPKSPFDFKKNEEQQQSAVKKSHRRHQSLGHTLSVASTSSSVVKPNIPTHTRRHSVALNGSKDVLKELEKNQGRQSGTDSKGGHRRSNSRNFDGNWRSTQPFQPFPPKYGMIKKQQQNQQNSNNQQQRKSLFAPYLPQANLPPLLKQGQLVSGVLRINKRNRSDAYVTTESLDADIYICGSKDRNRALEGDVVAVELLDPEKKKVDKKKDDVEVEGQGLMLFEDDDIVTDDQRPKYCGHVVAVMERMPGQLFSGTLALLRPSSTATKEREAAEKARREAEERAAGIEPKVEEPRDDRRDERNERPKIVWFKPTDKRVPLIAIPTEQAPSDFVENHQSYAQQLFVACIKRWPITSLHPFGTLVTQIGEIGDIDVETEALLKDNNVSSEEFNEVVTKCLPSLPWTIPEKEFDTRRDLRTARIFTIDPSSAKDLDDAVSCSRLPDGNYEIGVHIADTSYFVKPNTPLDRDARKRATTVYLVQKSVPMLPPLLCEELCSLNPGVERLAFSVIWKMTPEGKSIDTWYGRTIIRTCAKLSYENAQEVIDGKPLNAEVKIFNDYSSKEVEADIKLLHELSQRLRGLRYKRGALSLGSIKLNFELDEYNNPIECFVSEYKDANRLIEEFMLLANMSVAQKISSAFPEQALLRRHAPPIERRLNYFVEHASRLGYDFDVSTAGSLQKSFNNIYDNAVREVLRLLAIKPMQRAKYFCTGTLDIAKYHHYALNVPLYTHFTSPIRRYADVLVHRMLDAAISGEKRFYLDKDTVQKTANHCNVKKEAAKNAQEQSSHLFLCVLLHNLSVQSGPVIREAVVVGVKDHAFDVLVPAFGIEKRVHLDQLPLEKFIFDDETGDLTLRWKPGVSSLEPILYDEGFAEDDDDVLDVDEDALLADDYHYELMDVTSRPFEDENRLFDVSSDIGEDDIDDENLIIGDENAEINQDTISTVPTVSTYEFQKAESLASETFDQSLTTKTTTPIIKVTEPPQLSIDSDPDIPNSQIIRELCYLQVVITADCKKSPPVIKVLAVNPYA
ncbi:5098_t:CDS:10 [Funneliformis geosporum]|uniref:DIS3-like exonuclease 2 n=1 Tax=Funneliformis geosporum TaxID=1117311 RepID=A0A9W4STR3_9GLOM|nr:5098_t:CDS:10 [Funneliformis geosporum]CAI2181278.1 13139_t:CDS:10 [Funneliformis geosporum]